MRRRRAAILVLILLVVAVVFLFVRSREERPTPRSTPVQVVNAPSSIAPARAVSSAKPIAAPVPPTPSAYVPPAFFPALRTCQNEHRCPAGSLCARSLDTGEVGCYRSNCDGPADDTHCAPGDACSAVGNDVWRCAPAGFGRRGDHCLDFNLANVEQRAARASRASAGAALPSAPPTPAATATRAVSRVRAAVSASAVARSARQTATVTPAAPAFRRAPSSANSTASARSQRTPTAAHQVTVPPAVSASASSSATSFSAPATGSARRTRSAKTLGSARPPDAAAMRCASAGDRVASTARCRVVHSRAPRPARFDLRPAAASA